MQPLYAQLLDTLELYAHNQITANFRSAELQLPSAHADTTQFDL